jgi:hypothetical protein
MKIPRDGHDSLAQGAILLCDGYTQVLSHKKDTGTGNAGNARGDIGTSRKSPVARSICPDGRYQEALVIFKNIA